MAPALAPLSMAASSLVLLVLLHTAFPIDFFDKGTAGKVPLCFMGALVFLDPGCDSVLGPLMAPDFNVGPCCCCAIAMLANPIKARLCACFCVMLRVLQHLYLQHFKQRHRISPPTNSAPKIMRVLAVPPKLKASSDSLLVSEADDKTPCEICGVGSSPFWIALITLYLAMVPVAVSPTPAAALPAAATAAGMAARIAGMMVQPMAVVLLY